MTLCNEIILLTRTLKPLYKYRSAHLDINISLPRWCVLVAFKLSSCVYRAVYLVCSICGFGGGGGRACTRWRGALQGIHLSGMSATPVIMFMLRFLLMITPGSYIVTWRYTSLLCRTRNTFSRKSIISDYFQKS